MLTAIFLVVVYFVIQVIQSAPKKKKLKTLKISMMYLNKRNVVTLLGFNATLTAKVILWRLVTHVFPGFLTPIHAQIYFQSYRLLFSHERRKYAGKTVRLNLVSNSQPPGHESNMLSHPGGVPVKRQHSISELKW